MLMYMSISLHESFRRHRVFIYTGIIFSQDLERVGRDCRLSA